jgi:hypothetical protein
LSQRRGVARPRVLVKGAGLWCRGRPLVRLIGCGASATRGRQRSLPCQHNPDGGMSLGIARLPRGRWCTRMFAVTMIRIHWSGRGLRGIRIPACDCSCGGISGIPGPNRAGFRWRLPTRLGTSDGRRECRNHRVHSMSSSPRRDSLPSLARAKAASTIVRCAAWASARVTIGPFSISSRR